MSTDHHSRSSSRYFFERVRRHWEWGRTEGFGRLIEEDQLHPIERTRTALSKWRWRRANPIPAGSSVPVWVVGVQRSGTNMILQGLEQSPNCEVHNENDRRAFDRFELRDKPTVVDLIGRSRHEFVLFKPLCDSHRTDELLEDYRAGTPGKAIWAYRDVDGRARSAVSKFGGHNLEVMKRLCAGETVTTWHAGGLGGTERSILENVDLTDATEHDGAALFWWLRNRLLFSRDLDQRDDVFVIGYEQTLQDPQGRLTALCAFLGMPMQPELAAHIAPRESTDSPPLDLLPEIRTLCDELGSQLRDCEQGKHTQWTK